MARPLHLLGSNAAKTLMTPGRHADGGGLYLSISPNGGRRWTFLTRKGGKQVELGLGSARDVTLASARKLATDMRSKLAAGDDPKAARKPTEGSTFGECADQYIEAHRAGWRNHKHRAQWDMSLREHAKPLRPIQADQITTDDVLSVLKPIWQTKPDTASRLRGRIECVLGAARAKAERNGNKWVNWNNPARWYDNLEHELLSIAKIRKVKHHAAMPYKDLPAFIARLRDQKVTAARALEFAILTAARSGEVLGARWDEMDLDESTWTVPAQRMKAGKAHCVPLSRRALEIVNALYETCTGEYVFPGQKPGKSLSGMVLEMVLHRMKIENATVHGFRSTFRDWAGDRTPFPRDVCEAALAHKIKDETERAYRRTDALEKRRTLMDAWAAYCAAPATGKVVSLRSRSRG